MEIDIIPFVLNYRS